MKCVDGNETAKDVNKGRTSAAAIGKAINSKGASLERWTTTSKKYTIIINRTIYQFNTVKDERWK